MQDDLTKEKPAATDEILQSPPKPVEAPVETPTPQEEPEKLTKLYNVPKVFKSTLAHIRGIEAKDGFLMVYTEDGKVHRKTAEEVREVARNCATMLEHMKRAELAGAVIPDHVKRQTLELISSLSVSFRKAKYQQETALKLDHVTRAVGRISDNLAWQKGGLPERGAYTTDHLPEESNIRYLCQRFPTLTEGEIAGIMRATDVPHQTRLQILAAMNGKRMMEQNRMTAQDVLKLARDNGEVKLPTGVGMMPTKELTPKIVVPVSGGPKSDT